MSPTPITQPCAVALEAEAVKALAADLTKAVRRLHRVMKACEQCPNADDCAIARQIQSEINAAIQIVSDEWSQL
jgi:hypothetical protein